MKLFRGDGPRPLPLSERLYRRFFLKYHARYLITGLQARARGRASTISRPICATRSFSGIAGICCCMRHGPRPSKG